MPTTNSCNIVQTPNNSFTQYVEGTWTPTVSGSTTAGAGTYTVQVGRYTRIGNMVNVFVSLTWTAHTGTGNLVLTALPFTIRNITNYTPLLNTYTAGLNYPTGTITLYAVGTANTTQAPLLNTRDNNTNLAAAMDTAASLTVQGWYLI